MLGLAVRKKMCPKGRTVRENLTNGRIIILCVFRSKKYIPALLATPWCCQPSKPGDVYLPKSSQHLLGVIVVHGRATRVDFWQARPPQHRGGQSIVGLLRSTLQIQARPQSYLSRWPSIESFSEIEIGASQLYRMGLNGFIFSKIDAN